MKNKNLFSCLVLLVILLYSNITYSHYGHNPDGIFPIFDSELIVKLDAEEAGYERKFRTEINSIISNSKKLYEALIIQQAYKSMNSYSEKDNYIKKHDSIISTSLENISQYNLSEFNDFQEVISPKIFLNIHNSVYNILLNINNKAYEVTEKGFIFSSKVKKFKESEINNFYGEMDNLFNSLKIYNDEIDRRVENNKDKSPLYLIYTPPTGGFKVSLSSKGAFTIKLSKKTPFGTFDIAHSESGGGVHTLIVENNNMKRYFLLGGRDFEFYVPTRKGVNVKQKDNQIILEVR